MFNMQLLLLLIIIVTAAFADDNSTRARDPRLTVINIYSGLEEVNDLNKNGSGKMYMSTDDEKKDSADDDEDESDDDEGEDMEDSIYDDNEPYYEDEEDEHDELPLKKKRKHHLSYSGMQKLGGSNKIPDKVQSKEKSIKKKKSKSKPTVLKHHKRSKIFYSNADISKRESPNYDTNTNGIDNNDFDKVKVMREFVTDKDGFWPKTYNWNSFRKVIQLINEISY